MQQASLKEIVKDIRSLEPFPTVVSQVLSLSAGDDVIPGELIGVIQTDPGMTSKILKLCNSAYYGFQRKIPSLSDAGNLLGVSTLVNLTLTCSANKYFRDYGSANGRDQAALWQSCLTLAIAAKLVAGLHRKTDPELAYTAGLMQNMGNLVLDRFYDDGRTFVDLLVKEGTERVDAEREVLGLNHAEIGARLLSRWDLPDVLVDSVRFHHKPEQARVDQVLTCTIHLAETVGAARLAGDDPDALTYEVSQAALELTGLERDDFEAIDGDLQSELERAQDMFGA